MGIGARWLPRSVISNVLLGLGRHASDRGLLAAVSFVRRLVKDEGYRRGLDFVERRIRSDHGGVRAARRLVTELSPRSRRCVVDNFLVGSIFHGYRLRYRFWEKNGFNAPAVLVISPTTRCNLRCTGCYDAASPRGWDLEDELVERLVTEAEGLGTNLIVLTGGEPLVRPGLLDLVARHPRMAFQIYTNGTLVTDEVADRLGALGNAALAISVEGTEEETDARRGRGVYRKIVETMGRLRARGVLFAFSATATRHNVESLTSDAFVERMIDLGCLYGWYFTYVPVGKEPDLDLMPTPEQRARLASAVVRLRTRHPIFLADFWNDGELLLGCMSGGRRYLHVNAQGDVEPCVFAHFAVDRIRNRSLTDVMASPFFRAIREKLPLPGGHRRPCMIIDHPHVLRELVKAAGARPTRPGSDAILTDLAGALDAYSREYADRIGAARDPGARRDVTTSPAGANEPAVAAGHHPGAR